MTNGCSKHAKYTVINSLKQTIKNKLEVRFESGDSEPNLICSNVQVEINVQVDSSKLRYDRILLKNDMRK